MKLVFTALAALMVFGSVARADFFTETARCNVAANPNRGFKIPMTVELVTQDQASVMRVRANDVTSVLGTTLQVVIKRDDPVLQFAFRSTLAMFSEREVSGLQNPYEVTKIVKTWTTVQGTEVALFRFFAGERLVGGSFMAGVLATACLP